MDPKLEKIELAESDETDSEFLCSVYAATRADEVRSFGWDDAQARVFLEMQFAMRTRSYEMQFPAAVTYIVLFGGTRAGSIIVDRTNEYISLTDIAILPIFRGKGIATYLIRMLQGEATASGKPLTLHVDKSNANALRLYESLGFDIADESDLDYSMQWNV